MVCESTQQHEFYYDCRYECAANLGELLMEGGASPPDFAGAAMYYGLAAQWASLDSKPKLSLKYFDLAANAEGMMEDEAS